MECLLCEKEFNRLHRIRVLSTENKYLPIDVCDKCRDKVRVDSILSGFTIKED